MGDLASWDDEGRLWFAGRTRTSCTPPTVRCYSVPCEEVFNLHPAVRRSALTGTGPVAGQTPVLVVQLEPGQSPSRI
jgi:acyl-coenzyme A synthetase/AMP-(fatty) acid ligase